MAKRQAKAVAATESPATIIAFKGFDANFQCRGFQYEVGKTYKHSGEVVRCAAGGFHSCEMPLDIFTYYESTKSRFAEVEVGGALDRGENQDSKIASAEITIRAELKLPDIIRKAVAWIVERAKENTATGDSGHAAATGYGGHAAATGYRGHAAVKGKNAIAIAAGAFGVASADDGGAIMLAAYDDDWNLVTVFASKVGENGIEAGKAYHLGQDGKPVDVTEAA